MQVEAMYSNTKVAKSILSAKIIFMKNLKEQKNVFLSLLLVNESRFCDTSEHELFDFYMTYKSVYGTSGTIL
jgi:hypothetical protein